jgi:hypothetical protein
VLDSTNLRSAKPEDLLALFARIVDELLSQGVVRSTNNPVADYSEYLTARAFGLTLVANSSIGYDAISDDDVRYQVKARRLTPRNGSRQLGFIRGLEKEEDPFDVLVGILFNADFSILRAALVPMDVVRGRVARVDYVNAWRIILTDALWSVPGVEDVTDRIRAAAAAPAIPPTLVQATPPAAVLTATADPTWAVALERYAMPLELHTRARGSEFKVEARDGALVITPDTGRPRRVFAAEFLQVASIIDSASRRELQAVTFNSSYLEAVLTDLRSAASTRKGSGFEEDRGE